MFWRRKKEEDLERELRSHLELEAEEQRALGASPEEASYAAQRAFGNTTRAKEDVRQAWGWTGGEDFAKDILYGLRAMRKNPGLASIAILTLALGIGANTAIFSILDSVLLRPLPYPQPDRLVRIWQSEPQMGEARLGTAPPEFAAYRDRTRAFSSVAGYQPADYARTGSGKAEHIHGYAASASLFQTLGVSPHIGRVFTAKEELPGAAKVVVLSYRYWRRHYAEDPRVLGTVMRLNEEPYRIVGVMPRGFTFPSTPATPGEPPALWTPLSFTPRQMLDWASSFDTSVVARLRDGVSVAQARDDVRRVAQQFQREHADIYSGNIVLDATAEQWAPDFGERVPTILYMLSGAAGFVLPIACANIANLLLARAAARQRGLSIRRALGASPARLMRQIFTETALLTIIGCLAGLVLAFGLIRLLEIFWTNELNLRAATIDLRVLLFTFGVSALTCVLCGLSPALSAPKSPWKRVQPRLARAFAVCEIACSVVLLIGAGLLLESFIHVIETPLGFDPDHALIVRTTFNRQRYSPEHRHDLERLIAARLSGLPGVEAVAITTHVPLADEREIGFVIDGAPPDEFHWADNALVSGNYFRVMQIPLLSGRTFSEHDTPASPMTAVINEGMARKYWPGQDPVGKAFQWGGRHISVVGVVADVHIEALDKPVGPEIYNSIYQIESGASTSGVFILRLRPGQSPMQLASATQNVIWSIDRGLPILGFTTLQEVVSNSVITRRAALTLVGGFGLVAMILALIGIYGVLAHSVVQRTKEMGVRLAIGAQPAEIVRLILRDGVRMAIWGIAFAIMTAGFAATLISKLLFHVQALDPACYTAGAAIILILALLASYLPARRAAQADPLKALRYE